MKRLVYLLLAVVLIAACLFSCSVLQKKADAPSSEDDPAGQTEQEESAPATDEDALQIEQLADRCRTACNELDIEGILDCIHPSAAKPMRTMLGLAGTLSGTGEEQVMDFLCQLLGAESSDHTQFCKTLDTELSDVEVDGDKATASLHYTYEEDGKRYGADADLTFKCVDGQWYISNLQGK